MSDLLSEKQRLDTKQSKNYYENDKERLREHARDKCRNLSEEEKNIKREYGKSRYTIICLKKKKVNEYQKSYRKAKYLNIIINKIVF